MKKSTTIKRTISATMAAVMAVTMLFCGAFSVTAGAMVAEEVPIEIIIIDENGTRASDHIRAWSPLLSRTSYGASVTFTGNYSGKIKIELQNSSGTTIDWFEETFTNRNSIAYTKARATASGTYRIRITVTIGSTVTPRTSHYMNLA